MTKNHIKTLEIMIKAMKKHGLTILSFEGISVSMPLSKPKPKRTRNKTLINNEKPLKEEIISDEDMLFWSTPSYQEDKLPNTGIQEG